MKSSYLFCLFFLVNNCFAQNDSLLIAHTKWEITKIAPGMNLKQRAFSNNLFGSNQYISILEIRQRKKNRITLANEVKILRTTSDFGQSSKAIAAMNGTFFDTRNGGSVDYIRLNEQEINENRLNSNGERTVHQRSAVVINGGKLSIARWDGTSNWEKNIKGDDIMVTGPLLVWNNRSEPLTDTASLTRLRHPRTAVGSNKNKILFITVDGRHENAAGMTLSELSGLLRWLHASYGINLDGGGSSTLWVNGKVVNHPSDNKKWDNEGERKVANTLLIMKK